MNHDLIIKLIKLANNNPNEHEANAAARKVCQLLAEANFSFDTTWYTEPEFKPPPDPFKDIWVKDIFYKTKSEQRNYYNGTQTEQKKYRCIHCRKAMNTDAEITNKICAECWRKEREKFGL